MELNKSLTEWLATQGYALEFATNIALSDAGLQSAISFHIENHEGTWREIDVVAFENSHLNSSCPTQVRFCCECKYSKAFPWVLMATGLGADLFSDWRSLPQSKQLQTYQTMENLEFFRTELEESWHFRRDQVFAHSLIQGLRKERENRDDAFNALQKISNAAWNWAEEYERDDAPSAVIVIPCVIVDGPLYWATYNVESRSFEVQPIQFARLAWTGCRGGTNVDVVQANSVQQYAKEVKRTFEVVVPILEVFAAEHFPSGVRL